MNDETIIFVRMVIPDAHADLLRRIAKRLSVTEGQVVSEIMVLALEEYADEVREDPSVDIAEFFRLRGESDA